MLCDNCKQNPATVHLTEIVNKKKTEKHLCEKCAEAQGVSLKASFSLAASVQNPPAVAKTKVVLKSEQEPGASCPVCGMTFAEFRSCGRLGCANDYVAFRRGLLPLLDKIHGRREHKGKVPQHATERIERQRKVAALRKKLNAAIQKEAYEEAAKLRDQIFELEEQ